jgi:simple sugar transport system substrate-binding protein
MRKLAIMGGVAAMALTGTGVAQDQERYTYIMHSTPTNVFWQAVKRGMDDACALIDADCQLLFLQQDGNFQEQLNNLEAAIAQAPDGLINTFAGGNIFDEALERAMEAGIPIIASNVDHPGRQAYRLAYVGQDLERRLRAGPGLVPRTSPRRARSTC